MVADREDEGPIVEQKTTSKAESRELEQKIGRTPDRRLVIRLPQRNREGVLANYYPGDGINISQLVF